MATRFVSVLFVLPANPVVKPWVHAVLSCGLVALSFTGCTRSVTVQKQMTWECAPDEYNPAFYARPDEYVRFRYIEEPHCFEVESARNLCAELRSIGKHAVMVDIKVWGGPKRLSTEGYKIVDVEGHPLRDVGGSGNSGSNDFTGVCPISKVINSISGVFNAGK